MKRAGMLMSTTTVQSAHTHNWLQKQGKEGRELFMNYDTKAGDRAASSRIATSPAAISAGEFKSSGSLSKLLMAR